MTNHTDIYVLPPYIYINGGVVRFIYPATDEANESDFIVGDLPTDQADAILSHGFPVIIEGINDEDTWDAFAII